MSDNFYHVYELPERSKLAKGFAFNGGNAVEFLNVDWFNDMPESIGGPATRDQIAQEVRRKKYFKPEKRYLVLGSPGLTFVIG